MKILKSDLEEAYKLLSQEIDPSPLVRNDRLSITYGCNVYLKLENMLPVGSFKLRGALYKISKLTQVEKKRGVLAVSAGNHGQGVAWAAKHFKTKATIVMPVGSPLVKVECTKSFGARVILHGANIEESFEYAKTLNEKEGLIFVHPFEDPHVIAGQSTIANEVLVQMKGSKVDFVFGSIGGGGLLTGVATVFKEKSLPTKVIGAQASGASSMINSLREHRIVHSKYSSTFADGIKVRKTSKSMFHLLKKLVDIPVDINDAEISMAVLELLEQAHVLAEGAGALPLAAFKALHSQDPKKFKNKNIVLIICGGNIDINVLGRIIDKGLIHSGRRARLSLELQDKPGELSLITGIISEAGANILQVYHDDESPHISLFETTVQLTIDTKGRDHLNTILKKLGKYYKKIKILD